MEMKKMVIEIGDLDEMLIGRAVEKIMDKLKKDIDKNFDLEERVEIDTYLAPMLDLHNFEFPENAVSTYDVQLVWKYLNKQPTNFSWSSYMTAVRKFLVVRVKNKEVIPIIRIAPAENMLFELLCQTRGQHRREKLVSRYGVRAAYLVLAVSQGNEDKQFDYDADSTIRSQKGRRLRTVRGRSVRAKIDVKAKRRSLDL